jgi:acetoin utilization protein AcuB
MNVNGGNNMLVRDWMTRNPATVGPRTPIMEAVQVLREGGFRRLPVMDDGRLVGIVTERDLKEAAPSKATSLSVYELNYLISRLLVRDIMVSDVVTIDADATVEQAALLMAERKVSGLPVLADGKLAGILTVNDVLEAVISMLGLREGGTRVTVSLPDEPGVLARAAQVAAPGNIVGVATEGVSGGQRRLVIRVTGEGAATFADRVSAAGVDVLDVR